jgi:hypothetical protein
MTKKKKISSHFQPGPTLFELVQEATRNQGNDVPKGSLDIRTELKCALAEDLRHAVDENGRDISRAQVAARMTDELGREVTLSDLNNWTATSHPHEISLSAYVALFKATGNQHQTADVISRHTGLFLLPGPEALRAELTRRDEVIEKARAEKREIKALLHEFERRRN